MKRFECPCGVVSTDEEINKVSLEGTSRAGRRIYIPIGTKKASERAIHLMYRCPGCLKWINGIKLREVLPNITRLENSVVYNSKAEATAMAEKEEVK